MQFAQRRASRRRFSPLALSPALPDRLRAQRPPPRPRLRQAPPSRPPPRHPHRSQRPPTRLAKRPVEAGPQPGSFLATRHSPLPLVAALACPLRRATALQTLRLAGAALAFHSAGFQPALFWECGGLPPLSHSSLGTSHSPLLYSP